MNNNSFPQELTFQACLGIWFSSLGFCRLSFQTARPSVSRMFRPFLPPDNTKVKSYLKKLSLFLQRTKGIFDKKARPLNCWNWYLWFFFNHFQNVLFVICVEGTAFFDEFSVITSFTLPFPLLFVWFCRLSKEWKGTCLVTFLSLHLTCPMNMKMFSRGAREFKNLGEARYLSNWGRSWDTSFFHLL